jgi:hypothetical protein
MSMARLRAEAEAAEKELEGMGATNEDILSPEDEERKRQEEEVVQEEERQPEEPEVKEEEPEEHPELDALKDQLAKLEHRLSTVQGILKKSESENKALHEKITELSAVPVKKEEPPKIEDSEYFDALKEEFGEKTAKAMISVVRAETSSIQKENAELRELLKQTGERTKAIESGFVKSAEDRYFESLAMKHPDWESLNGNEDRGLSQDTRFTKFLGEKVPGTGKSYNTLLQEAYDALDVSRTAEIFAIFKDRHKVTDPGKRKSAEDYIDPSITGRGVTPPKSKEEKKIYTQAEHKKLMMQLQTGNFRGTREDRDKLADELIAAELEGRIR